MKNFVKYTLAIAICAAALLSSCIKEENFKRDTVQLNVTLTRSSADSTQPGTGLEQGDKIEDVTLWAFSYTEVSNGFPVIADNAKAVGYRYVSGITNTYGSIGIHVPLPTCDNTANYLIVAVINRSAFGKDFSLGQGSTWKQIREANFTADGAFWSVHPQSKDPELMPVSNWAAFTINSGNVHEQNTNGTWKCYNLQLPVYRAVAKSQLYMAKTSENFILVVKEAKVVANSGYTKGKVLTYTSETDTTKSEVKGLPSASDSDWWWTDPTTTNSVSYAMRNTAVENSPSTWNEVTVSQTGSAESPQNNTFQWVGSTFLLENDAVAGTLEERNAGHDSRVGDGYNLYVKYTVDGQPYEVYTPLGKVVRNHDYQVKATVDAGGELTFEVVVNDWVKEDITMDYKDVATVTDEGYIKWTDLPIIGDNTVWNQKNANDQVENGIIKLASSEGSTATFTFQLLTPLGGDWIAELRPSQGKPGSIVFVTTDENGNKVYSSTLEGKIIDGVELNEITITTIEDNLIVNNGIENIAVLYITARGTWADQTEHSYIVDGIVGPNMTFKNYTISQPAQ